MRSIRRPTSRSKERLARLADEELMELVPAGDADAFEVVLARHADAAYSLAYRMCGRRTLAEDITQEAFLALWRGGGRYDRARGSVRAWTLGIVHNRAADALRHAAVRERRHAHDEDAAGELASRDSTDAQAVGNVAAERIRSALRELPGEQRRVIELAYFGGFTQSEIAEMLGDPLGTVKGRMRLGLVKLRSQLHGWESVGA
jgi:RNA polymerase sigma-70 factor (ECF subfamily)